MEHFAINKVYCGDSLEVLKTFPDESIDCCVTSPPYYGLRDYGMDEQLGMEETPQKYVDNLVNVFNEVKRVLTKDGTLWLNLGDCWAGSGQGGGKGDASWKQHTNRGTQFMQDTESKLLHLDGYKSKDLIGIPWMVAFALRDEGWYLRQDIIWAKGNPMPESVKDRCTKSHEYIFLLSKSRRYYFDYESIKEYTTTEPRVRNRYYENYNQNCGYPNGDRFSEGERIYGEGGLRHKRDVWNVNLHPQNEAHFATYPEELIMPCILAGCPENGVVLDPFMGSGTTGIVAKKTRRNYVGIELNPDYIEIAERRIKETLRFKHLFDI